MLMIMNDNELLDENLRKTCEKTRGLALGRLDGFRLNDTRRFVKPSSFSSAALFESCAMGFSGQTSPRR